MKPTLKALQLALLLTSSVLIHAETPLAYQVTGPVVELTESKIVVQKGDEKWELARDKSTKVAGDLKVGSKVTIQYRMVAVKVDVKTAATTPEKKPAAKH